MIRFDLLSHAIENRSLEDFPRFLLPAIESFEYISRLGAQRSVFDPLVSASGAILALEGDAFKTGAPRDHLRGAAVAFGFQLVVDTPEAVNRLDAMHAALEALVGQDLIPEWSTLHAYEESEGLSVVARYLSAIDRDELLPVEAIFTAHLRSLEWARRSNHRDSALNALQILVRRDWEEICAERRAVLVSPTQNVPVIEQALASNRAPASFIAAVLLAAEAAVSLGLSVELRNLLAELRDITEPER